MPIRDWRELQNMVDQKQAGRASSFEDLEDLSEENTINIDPGVAEDERRRAAHNQRMEAMLAGQSAAQIEQEAEAARQKQLQQLYELEEQVNSSADDYGYGDYRKDTKVPFDEWRKNPFDTRANLQTPIAKLANGAAKMLPYAATTFLDDTVGLVAGILNVGADAINGGEFRPGRSFINTPFADAMQRVRDWSEEALPNYRTEEEVQDAEHWWRHMNANFWGDTFIKNLGFTIGAGASAVAFGSGFRALEKGAARKAYRGAVSAASGDSASINGFRRILQGDSMQNPQALNTIFEEVSKSAKKLGPIGQIVAGTSGAIGESRVEALQAAKEFRDAQNMKDSVEYNQALSELAASIADTPEFIAGYDEDGYPIINDLGKKAFESGQNDVSKNFAERQKMIDDQAYALANTTFWLNMPLLTATNMIMFGKLVSGGYKTQSRAAIKGAFGNRTGRQTIAGAVAEGFKTPISEGMEELSQKVISEGAKDIASTNAAAFTNGKYDKNAIKSVSEWMSSMLNSAGNVLVNPQSWEEFAIGALTGAIGPGGNSRVGGSYAAVKAGLEQRKQDQETAQEINDFENGEKFRDLLGGIVRHTKLENVKDQALKDKQEFVWQTAQDEQLINAVMMYDKAGALDELDDMVDSFINLKEEDLPQIKQLLSDEVKEDFSRRSDSSNLNWIHKQGQKVKNTIQQYRDAYEALDYLSFGTSSEDAIKELIYTKMQLKNFEDRYNSIFDDVVTRLRPSIEAVARETNASGEPTKAAEQAQSLLSSESELRTLFGGKAFDVHGRAQEGSNPMTDVFVQMDNEKKEDVLNTLKSWLEFSHNDSVSAQEIEDLQKLVEARANFYSKLFDPTGRKSLAERHAEEAKEPEEVAQEIEEDGVKTQASTLLDEFKKSTDRRDFFTKFPALIEDKDSSIIDEAINQARGDSRLAKYIDYEEKVENFMTGLSNHINDARSKATDPDEIVALRELQNFIDNADYFDMVASTDDEADPELNAASYVLDALEASGSPLSEYYKNIIRKYYKRIADAKSLGSIPPPPPAAPPAVPGGGSTAPGVGTGSGGGTGAEGLGGSTGGEAVASEEVARIISACTDVNDSVVNAFANGDFTGYESLTDEEKIRLQQEAINKLAELEHEPDESDDDTGKDHLNRDDDNTTPEARAFAEARAITLNGTPFTYYAIADAKLGKKKRYQPSDAGTAATLKWMGDHNVPSFIDSGALARLHDAYESQGQELPVYFIANPHNVTNKSEDNPFAHNGGVEVLLAVEIDDNARTVLEKYNGIGFSESGLLEIDGKKYQVIGEIDQPTEDAAKAAEEKGDTSIRNIKNNAQLIWREAVDRSIKPQYQADGGASSAAIPKEGKWYVAYGTNYEQKGDENADLKSGKRLHTTIAYVHSGRNFTNPEVDKEGNIKKYNKTPLATSLSEYDKLGKPRYFYLATPEGVVTPGSSVIPDLGVINCPMGSLWMATELPNGKLSWNYITLPTVAEYDIDAYRDSKLVKDLISNIEAILTPDSPGLSEEDRRANTNARINAVRFLTDLFYTGRENKIVFSYEDGGVVLYVGGVACSSVDDVLQTLGDKGIRFNVNAKDVSEKGQKRIQELIDAGVLRSEMESFQRFNASIGVNMVTNTDADGNPIELTPVSAPVPFTAYSDEDLGAASISEAGTYNIVIRDRSYSISPEGVVRVMTTRGRNGVVVEDKEIVAQVKALNDLMSGRFNGRRWVVTDKKNMYTDLYEAVVDGIKVHIAREGKKNNFHIMYSDALWDASMGIAEEVKPRFINQPASTEPTPGKIASDQAKFDELRRKAGGEDTTQAGETVVIPEANGGKDMTGVTDDDVDLDAPPSLQELEELGEEEEEKDDCE